jgi:hypothetical protein
MVETKVQIRFPERGDASAAIESTAEGDSEKQAEIVLFCQYTIRVLRKLADGESAAPLVQSLAELENAPTADVVRGADQRDTVAIGDVRAEAGTGSGRLVIVQSLFSAPTSPRILLSVKARRFGVRRRGLSHALERSVLVVLASLLERRDGDMVYARQLTKAGGLIGRLARANPAVLANEVGAALAAADLAWRAGLGAPGLAKTCVQDPPGTVEGEIRCPACGTRAPPAPADRSFDDRVWPDATARLARCRRCGSGVWMRNGAAQAIEADAWRAMESIRSSLEDEIEPQQEASLFEALKEVFTGEGWSFSEIHPMPVLLTELNGPSGTWKLYAHAVEERQLILFYSICPLVVPPQKRPEMASFLTRANYGLAVGNFELDFADGEIRYKTSLNVEGGRVSPTLVRRLARVNGVAMERYLPGIAAMITGTPALPSLEEQRGV